MILTEADAKQRWCPFARVLVEIREGVNPKPDSKLIDAPASFNRKPRMVSDDAQASPLGACCIGSACMAWRWAEREALETVFDQTERPEGEGWEPYSDSPRNCAWKRPNTKPGKGYCGMAGTP